MKTLMAALLFYTIIPLPYSQNLSFKGIALYAPIVGIILAAILGLLDGLLELVLPFNSGLRSAIVVVTWVFLTGGLHLDGAMDTSDGLGVNELERRLTVMSDSRSGAYGVITAIVILGLKTLALMEISSHRFSVLLHALAWGRWGQSFAIVHYPYIKTTGKGKFHQEGMKKRQVYFMALFLLSLMLLAKDLRFFILFCLLTALFVGFIINKLVGGQTGDTYGAIVEWTETLTLVSAALILKINY